MSSYLWIPVIQMLGYRDLLTLRCLNNSFRQRVYDYGKINVTLDKYLDGYIITCGTTQTTQITKRINDRDTQITNRIKNYKYDTDIESMQKICKQVTVEIFNYDFYLKDIKLYPGLYQPSGGSFKVSRLDNSIAENTNWYPSWESPHITRHGDKTWI
jgi:hypothetical protein